MLSMLSDREHEVITAMAMFNGKKIGLALSGGGALGAAHIGIIEEIEKAGIKPDYVCGVSSGAIIGRDFTAAGTASKHCVIFWTAMAFWKLKTPVLQAMYGGGKAKPFRTHLNALDIDLYLRISPELYLKRLLIGGFEKSLNLPAVSGTKAWINSIVRSLRCLSFTGHTRPTKI